MSPKPKFKIGDKVKCTTNTKTGVVKAVYDADYWNLYSMDGSESHEYGVEYDDGSGLINLVEKVLELTGESNELYKGCDCGAKHTRNPTHHSSWCSVLTNQSHYGSQYNDFSGGD